MQIVVPRVNKHSERNQYEKYVLKSDWNWWVNKPRLGIITAEDDEIKQR